MNNRKSLAQLLPGETAIIDDVLDTSDENSLMEMGLTSGTPVRLVKFSPLGDPLELQVRGYHLSIRRSEAKHILVGERK